MSDSRVVELLEEIRELQRRHVENYKEALSNQREAIGLWKTSDPPFVDVRTATVSWFPHLALGHQSPGGKSALDFALILQV